MISFKDLKLSQDMLLALSEIKIDYVFQPIFKSDGVTVVAREALMRPKEMTVGDMIEKYRQEKRLHVVEVATFFGAMQEHLQRGYKERVSINSFPSDCMSEEEAEAFSEYFGGDIRDKIIIEILEYPDFSMECWLLKKESIRRMNNRISMDDYGAGMSDMRMVDLLKPDIVKLDRLLITGIDHDKEKERKCKKCIQDMHNRGIKVVAEGIETKAEFDLLVSLDADYFQGYYLGKPR